MIGQTSLVGRECTTPDEEASREPVAGCGHDCNACIADFEQTQQRVEHLWAELKLEHMENQQLWLEARTAFREVLRDLIPARRAPGVDTDKPGHAEGWDDCRAEIEARVKALNDAI